MAARPEPDGIGWDEVGSAPECDGGLTAAASGSASESHARLRTFCCVAAERTARLVRVLRLLKPADPDRGRQREGARASSAADMPLISRW